MFCPKCKTANPDAADCCVKCGVKLPNATPSRNARHASIEDSVIKADEVVVGDKHEHIHEAEDPSVRRQATMTGMICPICHQVVVGATWFKCPKCERKYIHTSHQDSTTYLCSDCSAEAREAQGVVSEGDILGDRYEIRRLLGQGGMGKVFLGFDRALNREFALKFLPPELAGSRSVAVDLQKEAEVLLDLAHGNLVRLYDLVTIESHRFLKLQYVDGPSLEQVLAESKSDDERLPVETALEYAKQISTGLTYLHEHGVIHRDLKPANLMLTSAGVLKIMDFGIAQTLRDTMSRVSNRPTPGTLAYMSPEQLQNKRLDARSDIYAFGCLLYELLSGHPPFWSGAIYEQHLHAEPMPLGNVPDHVGAAVMRALAKAPSERFDSCEALVSGLLSPPPDPVVPETLELDCGSGVTIKLALVPKGDFLMGSGEYGDEKPPDRVKITRPFYIGVYPVTQAQYRAVTGNAPSKFKGDSNPVQNVSWYEAEAFCGALSARAGRSVRLPTESEWEYACRAGTTTRYSFGDDEAMLGRYAWFRDNSDGKTHPVGQKQPNAWGLYDMHGNVWEWCSDWVYPGYEEACLQGPAYCGCCVVRGGCWSNDWCECNSTRRPLGVPESGGDGSGFRVVVDLPNRQADLE